MDCKLKYDLHTHTVYSHGKGSILDNAKVAAEKGLSVLGIADHGPGHIFYGINMSELSNMRADVRRAKEAFPGLDIKLGVEANIINPSGKLDINKDDCKLFDYIIAGYHYGVLGERPLKSISVCMGGRLGIFSDRQYNTEIIIKALYENDIKILTHPDDKIDLDIEAVAKACEETHTLMEINNHHLSLSAESLKLVAKYNLEFIIGSDAHRPVDVGSYEKALAIVNKSGIPYERIINLWK